MKENDYRTHYTKVVLKAWKDPQFKERLVKDPIGALKDQGIEIPHDVIVTVFENTDKQFFFVIPREPEGEMSEEQLESIAGGFGEFGSFYSS